MKRKLLLLDITSGVAQVEVLEGQKARVLAINAGLSGQSEGEQVTVTYSRSGQVLTTVASNPLIAGANALGATLGGQNTSPREAMTDPVTGAVTYDQTGTNVTVGLPDVWFTWSITVNLGNGTGALNNGVLTYEIEETN